jgi:3D (Asp-Asp-Asp) domain-containing protein
LKVTSILSGSALLGTALLTGSLIFSARTLVAETLPSQVQQSTSKQTPQPNKEAVAAVATTAEVLTAEPDPETPVVPTVHYVATAYSLRGRTASGRMVSKGLIAADPRVLPLGSRVRLDAGPYSGEYLVADTGGMVKGRRIDIWTPTSREAMRFGRRTVKLTVLSLGGKKRTAKPTKK